MKTILITGANRGIGLEMAKQYLALGWQVIACCRNPRKATELSQLAQERLRIVKLDVAKPAQIQKLSEQLQNESIDILINNAGICGPSQESHEAVDPTEWLEVLQVNTIAPQLISQKLISQLARGQVKIIVNISSIYGSIEKNDGSHFFVYRSAKSALNSITKCLAKSLEKEGIAVIAIHPGSVKTDMNPSGRISPSESVEGIRKVLEKITLKDTGLFFSNQNERLPW